MTPMMTTPIRASMNSLVGETGGRGGGMLNNMQRRTGAAPGSGQTAESALVGLNSRSFKNYEQNYNPLIKDLIGRLDSTELVDDAKAESELLLGKTTQAQNMSEMQGLNRLTPAQRLAMKRRTEIRAKAQGDGNINNARIAQNDLNYDNSRNLMQFAMQEQSSATDALANSAGLASSRSEAYKNGKAQTRSANTSLATGLAMAAILA
jgi:hypothetical protein